MEIQSVDSIWESGPQQSPQLWWSSRSSLPDSSEDSSLMSYQI